MSGDSSRRVLELGARLTAGELGTGLLMEGSFSQDKFLALPPDNWRLSAEEAPVGPLSATGIHLVDLSIALLGRPTEVWARLATRGSPFANGDTLGVMIAFESGATAILSAILATPFVGRIALYGSQGWMEIRDRTHPEHPSGWDVTVSRRGGSPATHFVPPHPAVRDNIEAFARAIAGGAAYPIEPRGDCRQRVHLRGHHALHARAARSSACVIPASASASAGSSTDARWIPAQRFAWRDAERRPYQEFTQGRAQALLGSLNHAG